MPIFTNVPDKVTIVPNEATPDKVLQGYKNVRTQFIDFVNKYNASKTTGTISLDRTESDAMKKLHNLWKTATPDKIVEKGGNYFFDMSDLHEQLDGKFPAADEDIVTAAWKNYKKVHSDWMQVIFRSNATIFNVQM